MINSDAGVPLGINFLLLAAKGEFSLIMFFAQNQNLGYVFWCHLLMEWISPHRAGHRHECFASNLSCISQLFECSLNLGWTGLDASILGFVRSRWIDDLGIFGVAHTSSRWDVRRSPKTNHPRDCGIAT